MATCVGTVSGEQSDMRRPTNEDRRIDELRNRHDMLRDCLQSVYGGCASSHAPASVRSDKANPPPGQPVSELTIGVLTEIFREKESLSCTLLNTYGVRVSDW